MSGSPARPEEVLAFWFGAPDDPAFGRARPEWFRKDDAFDEAIGARFGATIAAALDGGLDRWRVAPLPALARIVVLDQFTRNAFRGRPLAFAGDAAALEGAREAVDRGWDASYRPVQRAFCYLPFEHSEDLDDQRRSLALFGTLRDDPDAGGTFDWAQRHHDVIARFGRFPHRNAILGRVSTPEERVFLAQPGSSF